MDFNVPLDDSFNVTDDTRIRAAIPTIKKVLADGGAVVLMSHLGRPKNGPEDKFSLKHILAKLGENLGQDVKFASDCVGSVAEEAVAGLQSGEVLVLENLRFYKEETAGDEGFAEQLSKLGDVYVNDAFGTAHRAHASTTIVAKFFPNDKCFGHLLAGEIESIEKALKSGNKPITAVIGGAKVSGKIEIIKNLIDKVDNLIVGGGMAYTFVKSQGGKVGQSLVEDELMSVAQEVIDACKEKGVNLYYPFDTKTTDDFSNDAEIQILPTGQIPDERMGLDCGPETAAKFQEVVRGSKTILWNGPMGVFEFDNFAGGTRAIAEAVVEATSAGAFSLIGGGDSVAAINKYGLADKVSYISTGGGAMLEYLEGKQLPGIQAILN